MILDEQSMSLYADGRKRPSLLLECAECKTKFWKDKRAYTNIKDQDNIVCSVECRSSRHKNARIQLECDYCEDIYKVAPSKATNSKSGFNFCSRSCKDNAQRISSNIPEIQPSHYGTISKNYRVIAFRNNPKICMSCKYDECPDILEVHHKDCDRSNNKLDNLAVLCPICHRKVHKNVLSLL